MKLSDAEIEKLRQSGIRLDSEGQFWHEGERVTHHGLRAAFWRWLDRAPDNHGRYVLRLDENRFVYLDVDDTPLLVRSLRWDGDEAIGVLSDGSEETLDLRTLTVDGTRALVTVRKRLPARLTNAAWTILGERFVEEDGRTSLRTGALSIPIS